MKPFTWSYSLLSEFELCPKKAYHTKIAKDVREEEGEALLHGKETHLALNNRIMKNVPLPLGMRQYEKACARIQRAPGKTYGEQKMAMTRDFRPTDWFGRDVWVRSIIDVGKHNGESMFVGDWKTGKIKDDDGQLSLAAGVIFVQMPEVATVTSAYIWLRDEHVTSRIYRRDQQADIWNALMPRVARLEHAYLTTTFPARPSRLCVRYCPVSSCPHHGKG